MCDLGQRSDFIGTINSAGFARLRNRERGGDHLMRTVAAITCERRLQRLGGDFAGLSRQTFELEAAAEKLHRAAFVGDDVRFGVTQHDAPRRRDLRQRQRIGRGPGRHEENGNVAFKDFAESTFGPFRPVVAAIAGRIALVGRSDGIENGGHDTCRIVAGEIHRSERHSRPENGSLQLWRRPRGEVNCRPTPAPAVFAVTEIGFAIALPHIPWSTQSAGTKPAGLGEIVPFWTLSGCRTCVGNRNLPCSA